MKKDFRGAFDALGRFAAALLCLPLLAGCGSRMPSTTGHVSVPPAQDWLAAAEAMEILVHTAVTEAASADVAGRRFSQVERRIAARLSAGLPAFWQGEIVEQEMLQALRRLRQPEGAASPANPLLEKTWLRNPECLLVLRVTVDILPGNVAKIAGVWQDADGIVKDGICVFELPLTPEAGPGRNPLILADLAADRILAAVEDCLRPPPASFVIQPMSDDPATRALLRAGAFSSARDRLRDRLQSAELDASRKGLLLHDLGLAQAGLGRWAEAELTLQQAHVLTGREETLAAFEQVQALRLKLAENIKAQPGLLR